MRLTAAEKAALARRGALKVGRVFVVKFSEGVHVEGLGARAAAEAAIVGLARDGLRALLAPLRPPPARRLALAPAAPADPRPKARRRRRPPKAKAAPDPPDPLAHLKRSVVP